MMHYWRDKDDWWKSLETLN